MKTSIVYTIEDVPALSWNACAQDSNPFISHEFLSTLEKSGCVNTKTGWTPLHILVHDGPTLVGCAPCYLKTHSMGEYVFDHAWAEAYMRAGGQYYPKLQVSAPFTPATGPRLLVHPEAAQVEVRKTLVQAMLDLCKAVHASSVHATFVTKDDSESFLQQGFLSRHDVQYHWSNENYQTFDDFLNALSSRKRKAIRRERREALQHGISVELVTGADLKEHHWDAFFDFYEDTGARKWGRPYLNRKFFSMLGETMGDQVLLIMAKREERYIAGALNLIGGKVLYGRNWGCIEDHPFLHFELCYYQAIDYALKHGFERVEAGAQGDHKLARGYGAVQTQSCHFIADPALKKAVQTYLDRERAYSQELLTSLQNETPFKKEPPYDSL